MKKILSIILFVGMLISLLCVNTAADSMVGGVSDGVTSFDDVQSQIPFHVTVLNRSSRYAVDVEYTSMTISFAGGLVWDVNELTYVYSGGEVEDTAPKSVDLTIINHSDQAIDVIPAFDAAENIVLIVNFFDNGEIWAHTIDGVAAGSDYPKSKTLTVELTPTERWSYIAAYADEDGNLVLGDVTLAISMAND